MSQSVSTRPPTTRPRTPAARRRRRRSIVDQRGVPWRWVATLCGLVALAATVVVTVSLSHGAKLSASGEVMPAAVTGAVTIDHAARRVSDQSGISGVLAWDTQGWPGDGSSPPGAVEHEHVAGPVRYAVIPPIGGSHNAVWLNAGIYDRPVASERAVHDMEHGAVWITYDPALPASQIVELRTFVHRQTVPGTTTVLHNRYIVMSPWDSADLPAPIVISSWGHQLRVSSPDDPRLQSFVDTFRTSRTYSPELGEPVDGVPIATGGRPFSD